MPKINRHGRRLVGENARKFRHPGPLGRSSSLYHTIMAATVTRLGDDDDPVMAMLPCPCSAEGHDPTCRRIGTVTSHFTPAPPGQPWRPAWANNAAGGKQIWGEALPYEPIRLFHTVGPEAPELTEAVDVHLIETAPGSPESIRGVPWHMQRMLAHQNFQTPWRFVHTGIIAPGAGIGEHIHGNCEVDASGAAALAKAHHSRALFLFH